MTTRRRSGTSNVEFPRRTLGENVCERSLQDDIRLAYEHSKAVRLFRNNVGVLQDRRGNYVRYGLCPGSSDLIGWYSIFPRCTCCGYDFPQPVAIFAAIEVKRPGEVPTDGQTQFIGTVRMAGGVAGWASSVEEAKLILPP